MSRRVAKRRRRGFVLPLTLVMITLAFGAWAGLYGGTSASLRQERTRSIRLNRTTWTVRGAAQALRALDAQLAEPGELPAELLWDEEVTIGIETRLFQVAAHRLMSNRWQLDVQPSEETP